MSLFNKLGKFNKFNKRRKTSRTSLNSRKFKFWLNQLRAYFSSGLDNISRNRPDWSGQQRLAQSPGGLRPSPNQARPGGYNSAASGQKRHKYTPLEVKRMLRGLEKGPLSQPVMLQAATINSLLDWRMVRHFRGRERLFERLPFVLFQYIQGRPCDEIAHSVSYFSDGEDVEDTIDFAAGLIAAYLNRHH